jgi:hypothetical protein
MPIDARETAAMGRTDYRTDQGRPAISSPQDELADFLRGTLTNNERVLRRSNSEEQLEQVKRRRLIKEEELAAKMAEQEARNIVQTPQKTSSTRLSFSPRSEPTPEKAIKDICGGKGEDAESQQLWNMTKCDNAAEHKPKVAEAAQNAEAESRDSEVARMQRQAKEAIEIARAAKAQAEQDLANILEKNAETLRLAQAEAAQQPASKKARLSPDIMPEEEINIWSDSAEASHSPILQAIQQATAAASGLDHKMEAEEKTLALAKEQTGEKVAPA